MKKFDRNNAREAWKKLFVPKPHFHTAEFGSELTCSLCNPYCWKRHRKGNPFCAVLIADCGHPDCPMRNYRGKSCD